MRAAGRSREQRDAAEQRGRARRARARSSVSVDVPLPPKDETASTTGAGVSDGLGPGPVDDGAVGVGLLDAERVVARLASVLREEREGTSPRRSARSRRSRSPSDDGFLAAAVSDRALPAGRGHERVDREALRRRQLDRRRRRAFLLGRDGEREDLPLVGERDGRADVRVRRRAAR